MLTRRGVLTGAAAGAAGAALAGCTSRGGSPPPKSTVVGGTPFDPKDWASVRAQFALAPDHAQFAAYVFASHPASVRQAIERHRAGLDADPYGYLGANESARDEAMARAAAAYLETRPEQIAFTGSTTMGLGLVYGGLRLAPGDEVLTTEHDFFSTHEALRLRRLRDGAIVKRVRLYDDPARAQVDQIVSRLRNAIGARTRAVALTWVHSGTGVKLPIRAIADALAQVNRDRNPQDRVLLCVDAVHGFGVEGTTPGAMGADFLISGCHKWLFGPRGTGLIWGSPDGWARYTPPIPSFTADGFEVWFGRADAARRPSPAGAGATPGGYHTFEYRWALEEAFGLHAAIGRDRVAGRTHELATALKAGLAGIEGVTVKTPAAVELSAGLVCCEVARVAARQAASRLRSAKVLASATPYATSYLRFGASIVTDEADVDAAVRAVRDLT